MAPLPVEFHSEAAAETAAAEAWYRERGERAGDAFLAEVDHAVLQVAQAPARWPLHIAGTRRYLFRRFPFALVYREIHGVIQVVAVAHGRRRPGYWKARQA
ncbi:MAG: type II toxin-antitoxin system RelE/ParE family toxin [Candidatus Tectomicrobia bacterium]|uniref:Type II toxin-antitoxin system RelE/ParE family toxin n=1 Tax=Tectimicrobiota bacterium TaxID=2528274 RepID=A0A932I3H5_UNCTE|nr:type II toxin-antitoxin system RelE/ParE family toxin [Candidatus Tectomicrobia bacterium]